MQKIKKDLGRQKQEWKTIRRYSWLDHPPPQDFPRIVFCVCFLFFTFFNFFFGSFVRSFLSIKQSVLFLSRSISKYLSRTLAWSLLFFPVIYNSKCLSPTLPLPLLICLCASVCALTSDWYQRSCTSKQIDVWNCN